MDPLRIACRAVVAFVFLSATVRMAGKRTIRLGTAFDFVLALIIGDMTDDLVWGEVSAATFITAVGTLCVARILSGEMTWRTRLGGR